MLSAPPVTFNTAFTPADDLNGFLMCGFLFPEWLSSPFLGPGAAMLSPTISNGIPRFWYGYGCSGPQLMLVPSILVALKRIYESTLRKNVRELADNGDLWLQSHFAGKLRSGLWLR